MGFWYKLELTEAVSRNQQGGCEEWEASKLTSAWNLFGEGEIGRLPRSAWKGRFLRGNGKRVATGSLGRGHLSTQQRWSLHKDTNPT